jgi:hypothetical protein
MARYGVLFTDIKNPVIEHAPPRLDVSYSMMNTIELHDVKCSLKLP